MRANLLFEVERAQSLAGEPSLRRGRRSAGLEDPADSKTWNFGSRFRLSDNLDRQPWEGRRRGPSPTFRY